MNAQRKQTLVDDAQGAARARREPRVLADYRGLTVDAAEPSCAASSAQAGGEYRVVKNTLARLRGQGHRDRGARRRMLRGPDRPSSLGFEDPAAPAKVAVKVAKEQRRSSSSRAATSTARPLDRRRRRGARRRCPARTSCGRQFLATVAGAVPQNFVRAARRAAPQNFVYLLAARERAAEGVGGRRGDARSRGSQTPMRSGRFRHRDAETRRST